MEKKSCRPINRTKIFMLWPKKNSYKEFDNEKNSCGSKIPHPPHNVSNGPSLKFEAARLHCLSDVFLAVAVAVA